VIERVNEVSRHPIRRVRLGRLPALIVRSPRNAGTETLNRANLRLRCRVHHHHRAARAGDARGVRDSLRCISRAYGPNAIPQVSTIQLSDDVISTADFERPYRLKRFELEIDFR